MNTSRLISLIAIPFTRLFRRGIHFIYEVLIKPRADTEDARRREFILNVILTVLLPILVLLDLFIAAATLREGHLYRGFPFWMFSFIVFFFSSLLFLSRKGRWKLASIILIFVYFILTTYGAVQWGAELPLVAMSYVAIIIISSILINTRTGFILTGLSAGTLTCITLLQLNGHLHPKLYWKFTPISIHDPIQLSIFLVLIMTISWLSNREIESSLRRAQASEKALLLERDMLEIKVEDRTKELKQMQYEKTSQLYRFAEFGKLSTGLFHDLMGPLQTLVNSVSRIDSNAEEMSDLRTHMEKALMSSKRIGAYLATVKRQIRAEESRQYFSLNKEVEEAVDILQYRAREYGVTLVKEFLGPIYTYNNPLKAYQIAINLIMNAIEAAGVTTNKKRVVTIRLEDYTEYAELIVHDTGRGIPRELHQKVFEPFFTTKAEHGIGLGLSNTKYSIERDFNGTITLTNNREGGATFIAHFPLTQEPENPS